MDRCGNDSSIDDASLYFDLDDNEMSTIKKLHDWLEVSAYHEQAELLAKYIARHEKALEFIRKQANGGECCLDCTSEEAIELLKELENVNSDT